MTKTRIYAVLLAGAICISPAGCGNTAPVSESETVQVNAEKTADETSGIDISDVVPAEPTAPEEPEPPAESSASEPPQPTEKEKPEAESAPQQTEPPVQTEPQKPAEPAEPQKPQEPPAAQTQPPVPPEPESAPAEPSKPTEPAPQKPEPAPTEPEPEPTQPAQPEFDVSYWVSYAKSYAQSIGLELDSEAVSCWDNPIIASANSKYLERDLCGMLDKYSRDADITAVWIWAEPRTDTSWDIYIGYA